MPDTGAPWNIPYVAGTDLVRDWPTDSQELATAIANGLDAAGNAGIGTNVMQAVKTDTWTSTAADFDDVTGLTVTITPTSASSKILLIAQLSLGVSSGSTNSAAARFSGGNTSGYIGDTDGANRRSTISTGGQDVNEYRTFFGQDAQVMVYLDSPATTSATTYKVQAFAGSGITAYVNRSGAGTQGGRTTSSLTAIEVAA